MFMEKILALMGDVPVQFYPVCYAFGFIAFLWIVDKFFHIFVSPKYIYNLLKKGQTNHKHPHPVGMSPKDIKQK